MTNFLRPSYRQVIIIIFYTLASTDYFCFFLIFLLLTVKKIQNYYYFYLLSNAEGSVYGLRFAPRARDSRYINRDVIINKS